jgi:tRNA(Ile)-lysidine synthase
MLTFNKKYFPNTKFILALSGGVDSIAACKFLKDKQFPFVAVHVNNKFIPQDDEIATKVENFCKHISVPYSILTTKEKYEKGSKEDFCRKVRYDLLRGFAKKYDYHYICTAHHLDDCVESYFMNFLKGTPEYIPIQFYCKYPEVSVFRPFLLNKKVDFLNYLEHHNLTKYAMEDELNSDLSLMRNWSRNVILPMIEKKYKGLHKVVFKKMKKHLDEIVKD